MTRTSRLWLVALGSVLGVAFSGVILVAASTAFDWPRPEKCDVLADRTGKGPLTLEQGDRLEDCGMLTGMSRSAVRAVLQTSDAEPFVEDGGRLEYYQLSGDRPGTVYFSSCDLQLEYARNRVVHAEVICQSD